MPSVLPLVAVLTAAAAWPLAAQGTVRLAADPAPLVVAEAAAGAAPEPAEGAASYALEGVAAPSRLTARLGTPLPAGVTLWVTLDAPSGAVSRGAVRLTTAEQEVVWGIPAGDHPSQTVTYALHATTAAGTVPMAAVDVLFSLVPVEP
jgi:hypothetical protein